MDLRDELIQIQTIQILLDDKIHRLQELQTRLSDRVKKLEKKIEYVMIDNVKDFT